MDETDQIVLRALWQLATEFDGRSLGELIKAGWFHGSTVIQLQNNTLGTLSRDPAILYSFSREAFHRYFLDTLLFVEAIQEVCRREDYTFNGEDGKAWEKILADSDIAAAARLLLAKDTDFLFSILESVTVRADYYMRYINAESIMSAVRAGIEQLLAQVKEAPFDDMRYITGEVPRSADERHQMVVNIANRFAGSVIPNRLKKKRPKTKGWAFNYDQLCRLVWRLGDDSGPPQKQKVEKELGCSNLNRILRARWDTLQAYGHRDHVWHVLSEEIWERKKK